MLALEVGGESVTPSLPISIIAMLIAKSLIV